jgi:DNA-binding XRE family transcriptional regulator
MKALFTQKELNFALYRDLLPIECIVCGKTFYKTKWYIKCLIMNKNRHQTGEYCSRICRDSALHPPIFIKCKLCGKQIRKLKTELKKSKSGFSFCSRSCAAKYNNTHKTKGTRRSKLEVWIEEKLTFLYPDLKIHFNSKTAINSELDIYIPSLKLAFELNGIFHYEPIFGEDKLSQIQNNDSRKFQACIERDISLCIIDASSLKYFKEKNAQKYLDIIVNLIEK